MVKLLVEPALRADRGGFAFVAGPAFDRIAATAPGWSSREPVFWPEWVEKVDLKAAA